MGSGAGSWFPAVLGGASTFGQWGCRALSAHCPTCCPQTAGSSHRRGHARGEVADSWRMRMVGWLRYRLGSVGPLRATPLRLWSRVDSGSHTQREQGRDEREIGAGLDEAPEQPTNMLAIGY